MANKIKIIPSRPEIIRLDLIDRNPRQPRKVFSEESIRSLANGISAGGLHNPMIYVRPNPEIPGRYIIVAGERRIRAFRLLGVEEFEFRVIEEGFLPPYVISLIENKNREDLNPIDEAEAYRECMDEENMSVAQLSEYTGEHVNDIYRSLRLLKLVPAVKELIRQRKLTQRGAHNLVQFNDLSRQIKYAQQLIAGENPPELDEQLTRTSGKSDAITAAKLPKTAEGIIRRLLQFRQRSNPVSFLVKAFLDMQEANQLEGWRHFTQATRENFEAQLQTLVVDLQALERKMATLPETKRVRSEKPPAVQQTAPPPKEAVLTAAPEVALVPASAAKLAPPLKPAQYAISKQNKPVAKTEGTPTINELDAARKILFFISNEATRGRRILLSKKSLGRVLGNGASPESVQAITIKALRVIRRYWRASPDPNHPEMEAFIILVSKSRYDFKDLGFDSFMRVVMALDNSHDPVSVENL